MLPKLSVAGDVSYSSTYAVLRQQNFCRREWYACVEVVVVVVVVKQTVYCILAASKGCIKQTYGKIMRTQNTQNHITGNDLVQIE